MNADKVEGLRRVVRDAGKFAELNGWRHSKTSFNLRQLAGLDRLGGDDGYRSRILDHCFYFRELIDRSRSSHNHTS